MDTIDFPCILWLTAMHKYPMTSYVFMCWVHCHHVSQLSSWFLILMCAQRNGDAVFCVRLLRSVVISVCSVKTVRQTKPFLVPLLVRFFWFLFWFLLTR